MLKKFIVFASLFSLLVVEAGAATHNGLKAAFDELNYSLTIEWDQKDKVFYDQKVNEFMGKIRDLQKAGVSNEEIVRYTLSHVKDQRAAKDFEAAFNLISINKMSSEEAYHYMKSIVDSSYSRGASWVGEIIVGAVVLVILVAVGAIISGKARIEDGCYQIYSCDTDCLGNICVENCEYRCI